VFDGSQYSIGQHTVEARVTNPAGETVKHFFRFVYQENAPIINTFSASPTSGDYPLTVTYTIDVTDSNGNLANCEMDYDGDGTYDENVTCSGQVQHTYNAQGTYNAVLRASDTQGLSTTKTVQISVYKPNSAPVITTTSLANATENQAYSQSVSCSDPDGDPVSLSASGLPSWATFTDNGDGTATISGTPSYDYVQHPDTQKTDNVTITCSDSQAQDQDTMQLTTNDVNRAPYFTTTPPSQTVYYGGDTYYYDADAVDPDGDTLTFFLTGQPYNVYILNPSTMEVYGDILETGSFSIEYGIADGFGGGEYQFHHIQVNP